MNLFNKLKSQFSNKPLDRERFGAFIASELKKRGADAEYQAEAYRVRINYSSGPLVWSLQQPFTLYCEAIPEKRDVILERQITAMAMGAAIPDSLDETVKSRLVADLKPIGQVWAAAAGSWQGSMPRFIDGPLLLPGVVPSVVLDLPASKVRVPAGQAKAWGATEESLFQIGLANLRAASADKWIPLGENLVRSGWHDDYDAARAQFHDLVHRAPIEGERVIAIPTRNDLFVASGRDSAAIADMMKRAFEAWDKSQFRLSIWPYQLTDGGYVRYDLPSALAVEAGSRQKQLDAQTYQHQATVLAKLHPDMAFPNPILMRRQADAKLISAVHWLQVKAALPRTDLLAFTMTRPNAESQQIRVLWEDAEAILGGFVRFQDTEPARYEMPLEISGEKAVQLLEASTRADAWMNA